MATLFPAVRSCCRASAALACALLALAGCGESLGGGPEAGAGGNSAVTGGGGAGGGAAGAGGVDGPCATTRTLPLPTDAGDACVFELPNPPPGPDTSNSAINVFTSDGLVPRDPSGVDGWNYTDATLTAIEFYGPACDAIRAGQTGPVTITYHCSGIS